MEQFLILLVFILSITKIVGMVEILKLCWKVKRNASTLSFTVSSSLLFFARLACVALWLTVTYQFYFLAERCIIQNVDSPSILYNCIVALLTIQVIGMFSLTRLLFFHTFISKTEKTIDMSKLELLLVKTSCIAAILPSIYIILRVLKFTITQDEQDKTSFVEAISPNLGSFKRKKDNKDSQLAGSDPFIGSNGIIDLVSSATEDPFIKRLRQHPSIEETKTERYIWGQLMTNYKTMFPTKESGLTKQTIDAFQKTKSKQIYLKYYVNPLLEYYGVIQQRDELSVDGWPLLQHAPSDDIVRTIILSLKDFGCNEELKKLMKRLKDMSERDPELVEFYPLWENASRT